MAEHCNNSIIETNGFWKGFFLSCGMCMWEREREGLRLRDWEDYKSKREEVGGEEIWIV